MKTGIYRASVSLAVLFFIFSCAGSRVAGPQAGKSSRCIWVYGPPTTFFIGEDEKQAAFFIPLDQLEQLKQVGPVIQSKLDDKKYFIENRPNNLYLTSYLLQCSDSYFLFNYAVDFASGRVVWADYHVSRSIEGFRGITYWPVDRISGYRMENLEEMHSGENRNVNVVMGPSGADWRASLSAITDMCISNLSREKGIRVTTRSFRKKILCFQDLLLAIKDGKGAIIPPSSDTYLGRMMAADLLYKISLTESKVGNDTMMQYDLVGIQTTDGRTISRDESDIDMSELKSDMQAEYLEELAKRISDKIVERAEAYKRPPEPENAVIDEQTGEILEVIYENSLKEE